MIKNDYISGLLDSDKLFRILGCITLVGLTTQCVPNDSFTDLNYDVDVLVQDQSSGHTAVFFTDEKVGYVISYNGNITKTSDGGETWKSQESGTTKPLFDVFFVNDDVGYIAGGCNGTQCGGAETILLKTTNGGTTWSQLIVPVTRRLESIFFLDEMTGFAIGLNLFLSTTDGGTNWSIEDFQGGPVNSSVRSIAFANQNVGYISLPNGNLYRTLDGGVNWAEIEVGIDLGSLFFVDINVGYAARRGLYKTVNGGMNWSLLDEKPETFGLHFIDRNRGFAVGRVGWTGGDFGTTYGAIYTTSDGGKTWVGNEEIAAMSIIEDIYFPSAEIGYAIGSGSNILKITVNN